MPERSRRAIDAEAARTGAHANDVILQVLADELEIPFESNRRKEPMASTNGKTNGRVRSEDKVRVAIIGVGNCANSLLQGVEYYKDADPEHLRPGPHARRPRRLSRPRRRVHRRLRRHEGQGRQGPRRRDLGAPERHVQVRRRTQDRRHGLARHDARRARQVHLRGRREGARRHRRRRRDPQGDEHRRRRQLPPGRLRGGDEVVHGADPQGRVRDGELHARLHRQGRLLRQAVRAARPADHRRRHQVPGRRDDHAPRAHARSSASAASTSTARCS